MIVACDISKERAKGQRLGGTDSSSYIRIGPPLKLAYLLMTKFGHVGKGTHRYHGEVNAMRDWKQGSHEGAVSIMKTGRVGQSGKHVVRRMYPGVLTVLTLSLYIYRLKVVHHLSSWW